MNLETRLTLVFGNMEGDFVIKIFTICGVLFSLIVDRSKGETSSTGVGQQSQRILREATFFMSDYTERYCK